MVLEKKTHRLLAGLVALAALALITAVAKTGVGLNAITAVLLYLLVVLATSALADLTAGMATAATSGLLVNYYFLPPFGTLYVEAPEDWVAFAAYAITAVVVSHFAATVRRDAADADRRQAQALQLARFTEALRTLPDADLTPENLTKELRAAFNLDYCAVFSLGRPPAFGPAFAGACPSWPSADQGQPPKPPPTMLDAVAEAGADVCCLDLKDHGETVGALVLCHVVLSPEVAQVLSAVSSMIVRRRTAPRPTE